MCKEGGGFRHGSHPAAHLLPLLSRARWEKRMRRLMGHIKADRSLTYYHHGQNRCNLGKN